MSKKTWTAIRTSLSKHNSSDALSKSLLKTWFELDFGKKTTGNYVGSTSDASFDNSTKTKMATKTFISSRNGTVSHHHICSDTVNAIDTPHTTRKYWKFIHTSLHTILSVVSFFFPVRGSVIFIFFNKNLRGGPWTIIIYTL